MADFTGDFNFMYNVVRSDTGSFTLLPGAAAATNVAFDDNYGPGDPGDPVKINGAGNGLDGKYDYVGSTTTSEGGSSYIVYNVVDQSYYMLTNTAFDFGHGSRALGALDSSGDSQSELACFVTGTRIRTPTGDARVETLKIGDLVETVDGRSLPIRWIGRREVA